MINLKAIRYLKRLNVHFRIGLLEEEKKTIKTPETSAVNAWNLAAKLNKKRKPKQRRPMYTF